jgi:hypothetical protein
MESLWNQGLANNGTAEGTPIYVAKASDPLLMAFCSEFGGKCNASGVSIHVPAYMVAQQAADGHVSVIDSHAPRGPIEMDCWRASVEGAALKCAWAGVYALGGSGVSQNGSEGIHGGMAVTTVFVTGQELANGRIDHALGLNVRCLNDPMLYPADTTFGSDKTCDKTMNPPHYGNLVHLLWSPAQIASSAYSAPCKAILTALATYGAYLDDTGNNGLQINTQGELSYTANPSSAAYDPWPDIQSALNSSGDGSDNRWNSCLNRLGAGDFELVALARR